MSRAKQCELRPYRSESRCSSSRVLRERANEIIPCMHGMSGESPSAMRDSVRDSESEWARAVNTLREYTAFRRRSRRRNRAIAKRAEAPRSARANLCRLLLSCVHRVYTLFMYMGACCVRFVIESAGTRDSAREESLTRWTAVPGWQTGAVVDEDSSTTLDPANRPAGSLARFCA